MDTRTQHLIFFGLSLGILGLVGLLYAYNSRLFQRFFGEFNPLIVVALVVLLGLGLAFLLLFQGWFAIYQPKALTALLVPFGLAVLLALLMILADIKAVFPTDMNIAFPPSLAFYPVMGYVAEVVFHLLPLALLLIVLTALFPDAHLDRTIWLCILIASVLEPVFQMWDFVGEYAWWVVVFVGLHNFLFNLLQLAVFKRYDFVSMYSVRLAYYLLWHLVWGHLRLGMLF